MHNNGLKSKRTAKQRINVMMWCAVSVDARLNVNVALNRPSYQPSTYVHHTGTYPPNEAKYANDGNHHTHVFDGPCAISDNMYQPWWAVDLEVALYVHGVKFTNSETNCTYAVSSVSTNRNYHVRQKIAPFYFCNSCVKSSSITTILAPVYLIKFPIIHIFYILYIIRDGKLA